ncbi:lytic transglycosylase domain-containing protein [Clostridiaceae bacterium M8S5]|nr:lytic transglycosylase domain-containing protein [Clostridiaceae bacterium M8S5]
MAKVYKRRKGILLILCVLLIIGLVNIKKIGKAIFSIKYEKQIYTYAKEYSLDPLLVASIIRAESSFRLKVKSPKGAIGLMQIMPSTGKWAAKEMGIDEYSDEKLYDENTNISIGCWYINKLSQYYNGETDIILAAYNAGSGNVNKWIKNGIIKNGYTEKIPFNETKTYIKRVNMYYKIYKFLHE